MRILTLLSDFGSRSPYPAAMKAVVAVRVDAQFVDISHDVRRHDVREGAFLLASVAPFCPTGTGHLAVVGAGVGWVPGDIAASAPTTACSCRQRTAWERRRPTTSIPPSASGPHPPPFTAATSSPPRRRDCCGANQPPPSAVPLMIRWL